MSLVGFLLITQFLLHASFGNSLQYKNLLHFFTFFNCDKLCGNCCHEASSNEAADIVCVTPQPQNKKVGWCLACCWYWIHLYTPYPSEFCMCFFFLLKLVSFNSSSFAIISQYRSLLKTILWILKCLLWDYVLQYYHHLGWFLPSSCCSHHHQLLLFFDLWRLGQTFFRFS